MKGDALAIRAAAALELKRRRCGRQAVWAPHPENKPQQAAYSSEADELFYGGAAGGGKTELIIGLALTAHRRSIIFRREYPQLTAIKDRLQELAKGAQINWQANRVKTTDGRIIELGAVQYERDKEKYQGRPHDLVAFDEITHFTRSQYIYLTGWNRSAEGHRCRIVCTGNPPTSASGTWVIEHWAPWLDQDHPNPAEPGELRWFVNDGLRSVEVEGPGMYEIIDEDGNPRKVRARSRTFIPASVSDNPYMAGTQYEAVLQSLDADLRRALLDGEFTASVEDDQWQVIKGAWVDAAMKRPAVTSGDVHAIGIDPARGGQDRTVITLRRGLSFQVFAYPGAATPTGDAVAELVIRHMTSTEIPVGVDVVGIGGAVVDALRNRGLLVIPLSGGEASDETDASGMLRFKNKRSEWHWKLREALEPESGLEIAITGDGTIRADLCAATYGVQGDKIVVETKEKIKKRLGRSPDTADAIMYAWAVGGHRSASWADDDYFEPIIDTGFAYQNM